MKNLGSRSCRISIVAYFSCEKMLMYEDNYKNVVICSQISFRGCYVEKFKFLYFIDFSEPLIMCIVPLIGEFFLNLFDQRILFLKKDFIF